MIGRINKVYWPNIMKNDECDQILPPLHLDRAGHSGATQQRRYFFASGSGSAAVFFGHQRQAAAPLLF